MKEKMSKTINLIKSIDYNRLLKVSLILLSLYWIFFILSEASLSLDNNPVFLTFISLSTIKIILILLFHKVLSLRTILLNFFMISVAVSFNQSTIEKELMYVIEELSAFNLIGIVLGIYIFSISPGTITFTEILELKNHDSFGKEGRITMNKDDKKAIEIKNKRHTSIHEAGHTLIFAIGNLRDLIVKVKINQHKHQFDGYLEHYFGSQSYENESLAKIRLLINLAGVAAEKCIFKESSLGGTDDINKFNDLGKYYLAHLDEETYYFKPQSVYEAESNRMALSKLKANLMKELIDFFDKNKITLLELSNEIEKKGELDGNDTFIYLDKVEWPENWPSVNV